jgi:hypothetical protein
VFAVPDRSPLETDLEDIQKLPARAVEELEQFFRATVALEEKELLPGLARPRPRHQDDQTTLEVTQVWARASP